MSYDAQFNKAVEMVKSLPPSGSVQPSQEQKLDVSSLPSLLFGWS
jgi:hypothetical protein